MNKVIVTGTIYGDIIKNEIGQENTKILINIITRNDYSNKDGMFENTFVSCVAWNDTASFILRNFSKGDTIEIVGSCINENREKDGVKQYKDRVRIREVSFVPKEYVGIKDEEVKNDHAQNS